MKWWLCSVTLATTKKSCGCLFSTIKAELSELNRVGVHQNSLEPLGMLKAGRTTGCVHFYSPRPSVLLKGPLWFLQRDVVMYGFHL